MVFHIFICVLCTCHDNIILSSDIGDIYQKMWFCGSKQKVQSNNLTIKNIFTLFSVWFPEVPWKAKNVMNTRGHLEISFCS